MSLEALGFSSRQEYAEWRIAHHNASLPNERPVERLAYEIKWRHWALKEDIREYCSQPEWVRLRWPGNEAL